MRVMYERQIHESNEVPAGVQELREALSWAQAVIIGAGAGLSASAGFT